MWKSKLDLDSAPTQPQPNSRMYGFVRVGVHCRDRFCEFVAHTYGLHRHTIFMPTTTGPELSDLEDKDE